MKKSVLIPAIFIFVTLSISLSQASSSVSKLKETSFRNFFPPKIQEYNRTKIFKQNLTEWGLKTTYEGLVDHQSANYSGPKPSYSSNRFMTGNDIYVNIWDYDSVSHASGYVAKIKTDGDSDIFQFKNQPVLSVVNTFDRGNSASVDVYILDRIGSRVIEVQLAKAGRGVSLSKDEGLKVAKEAYKKIIKHALNKRK